MATITQDQIDEIYSLFLEYKFKGISRKEVIMRSTMNHNSAKDYFRNLKLMLSGERITRSMKNQATDYFLSKISEDFKSKELENSLSSLEAFADYYEDIHPTALTLHSLREIIFQHRMKNDSIDIEEENKKEDQEQNKFKEGKSIQVVLNRFERNQKARKECIEYYGSSCRVCNMSFNTTYGDIAESYIQVHHRIEISSRSEEYEVDPINDLIPVCPNCHAMLHKQIPAYTIDELKSILNRNNQ
jgi:5-methylcytosine-specific restriction protein A